MEGLLPGERIDDLMRNGLKLIQQEDGFRFGTDSVLLADFAVYGRILGHAAQNAGRRRYSSSESGEMYPSP